MYANTVTCQVEAIEVDAGTSGNTDRKPAVLWAVRSAPGSLCERLNNVAGVSANVRAQSRGLKKIVDSRAAGINLDELASMRIEEIAALAAK